MKIHHRDIISDCGRTQFAKLDKGHYFYPITDREDIMKWRRRACRAGRTGRTAFRVFKEENGFYIERIA